MKLSDLREGPVIFTCPPRAGADFRVMKFLGEIYRVMNFFWAFQRVMKFLGAFYRVMNILRLFLPYQTYAIV